VKENGSWVCQKFVYKPFVKNKIDGIHNKFHCFNKLIYGDVGVIQNQIPSFFNAFNYKIKKHIGKK